MQRLGDFYFDTSTEGGMQGALYYIDLWLEDIGCPVPLHAATLKDTFNNALYQLHTAMSLQSYILEVFDTEEDVIRVSKSIAVLLPDKPILLSLSEGQTPLQLLHHNLQYLTERGWKIQLHVKNEEKLLNKGDTIMNDCMASTGKINISNDDLSMGLGKFSWLLHDDSQIGKKCVILRSILNETGYTQSIVLNDVTRETYSELLEALHAHMHNVRLTINITTEEQARAIVRSVQCLLELSDDDVEQNEGESLFGWVTRILHMLEVKGWKFNLSFKVPRALGQHRSTPDVLEQDEVVDTPSVSPVALLFKTEKPESHKWYEGEAWQRVEDILGPVCQDPSNVTLGHCNGLYELLMELIAAAYLVYGKKFDVAPFRSIPEEKQLKACKGLTNSIITVLNWFEKH